MTITITNRALEELEQKLGGHKGYLKIKIVSEGLSCDSGIPSLFFVRLKDETQEVLFESNKWPVLLEKSEIMFFDNEDLKIDYSDATNSFQLKSPQRIINGRMSFFTEQ